MPVVTLQQSMAERPVGLYAREHGQVGGSVAERAHPEQAYAYHDDCLQGSPVLGTWRRTKR